MWRLPVVRFRVQPAAPIVSVEERTRQQPLHRTSSDTFFHAVIFHNIIYLFTAIGLLPGGSGYFTCKQNMKLVTTKFKSGGLHEKHVVGTWSVGNRLSICL